MPEFAPKVVANLLFVIILMLCGCETITTVAIDDKDVLLRTGDLNKPYEPIAFVHVQKSGLLVFGFIPVSPGTLRATKEVFISEGKRLKADAIINVEYGINRLPFPASFFWWGRGAWMKGTAVKIKE
ncbi:MAG: hypothetical protein ABIH42_01010 [Planctomycetota bacterium]